MIFPSSIVTTRVERAATFSEWVTMMTSLPMAGIFRRISRIWALVSVSREPVGSSARMRPGPCTTARARETACALDALACAFAFTETDTCAPNASHANGFLNHSLHDSSSSKRVLMRRFAEEWRLYAGALRRWKARDASVLERELIRAVCEMETSARRACGSSSRAEDFPEGSDARAILDALENDARVLRGKVRGLTGPEGVERFDRARRDARRDVARDEAAEDKNADATAPSVPGSETADPSSSTSSSSATRAARRRTLGAPAE